MTRSELTSEISPGAVRDQLSKIIASDVFAESPRMARFLRFTVEETLRGNASQLKETVIGTTVTIATTGTRGTGIARETMTVTERIILPRDGIGMTIELRLRVGGGMTGMRGAIVVRTW